MSIMEAGISEQDCVAQTVNAYPQTVEIFLNRKTNCVGCLLARFCTLRDVADQYRFDLAEFLRELRQSVFLDIEKE